jgi:hypothetical protein
LLSAQGDGVAYLDYRLGGFELAKWWGYPQKACTFAYSFQ